MFILVCLLGLFSVEVDAYTTFSKADFKVDAYTASSKADFIELPEAFNPKYVKQIIWSGAYSEKPTNCGTQNQSVNQSVVAEIFLFVDSALANKLGDDNAVQKYMSAAWNMVNRNFRQIQNPSVTVKLVGIRIARKLEDESFLNFLEDGVNLDGTNTLGSFGEWLLHNRQELPPHDIAYLATSRGLNGAAGMAYVNGACYDYNDRQMATAVGNDFGAFSGISTAAHEIGHTLGCLDFDGDGSKCPNQTNHVMDGRDSSEKRCSFSNCSKEVIKNYIATRGTCLYVNVGSAKEIAKFDYDIMPVDVMTLEEQCKQITGYSNSTFHKGFSSCIMLACFTGINEGGNYYIDAAPGTTEFCPTGKRCLDCTCK